MAFSQSEYVEVMSVVTQSSILACLDTHLGEYAFVGGCLPVPLVVVLLWFIAARSCDRTHLKCADVDGFAKSVVLLLLLYAHV